jgi:hypothetical protein
VWGPRLAACPIQATDARFCRNEYFICVHIYVWNGIFTHILSTLPAITVKPFPSFWQEIGSLNMIGSFLYPLRSRLRTDFRFRCLRAIEAAGFMRRCFCGVEDPIGGPTYFLPP